MLLYALGFLALVALGSGQTRPSCICLEELTAAGQVATVTVLRHAGDGSNRFFLGEQVGLVWIIENGVRLAEPYLNMTEKVYVTESSFDERGFLSLNFHPDYETNGLLYVYYSYHNDSQPLGFNEYTRLSELRVDPNDANKVDVSYERVLLDIRQPFQNHDGGDIQFLGGYLYLSAGDGGSAGDPLENGQDKSTVLGSIMRIDVNSRDGDLPYGIPPDNPFVGDSDAAPEVFVYGLRNAWRYSVDSGDRTTGAGKGRIFIGDVGQNAWEEINVLETDSGGTNFGWSVYEANECFKEELCGTTGPLTFPVAAYAHSDYPPEQSASVTGGYVYRGCQSPNLNGQYFFGDYINGFLATIDADNPPGSSNTTWGYEKITPCNECPDPYINTYQNFIVTFGVDQSNELYFSTVLAEQGAFENTGKVYKIVDPSNLADPC